MSDIGFHYQEKSFKQCKKALYPLDQPFVGGEFTKIENQAFQNCLVRYHDSFKVVSGEVAKIIYGQQTQ